jgi:hypothetical protein
MQSNADPLQPPLEVVPGRPEDSREFTIETTPGTTAWGGENPAMYKPVDPYIRKRR